LAGAAKSDSAAFLDGDRFLKRNLSRLPAFYSKLRFRQEKTMRYAVLTITFLSGLGLTASGLSAQTLFPMSAKHHAVYAMPVSGVSPLDEGRSAATPRFPFSISRTHYEAPLLGVEPAEPLI
jgi:membrane-associated protease RseP (regulator of RpoE activity)